jgi:2-methylcitrate dehydratase PrpD
MEPQTIASRGEVLSPMGGGHLLITELVEYLQNLQAEKLPRRVLEAAKHSAFDWLGTAIAGAKTPSANIIADTVSSPHGLGTLIGRAARASVFDAALVNGSASHATELDDVHDALGGHPSAAILPAVFALSELQTISGLEFLAGVVAGIEVQCKIAVALGANLGQRGFHPTSIIGTLGAAAAVGYLIRLNSAALSNAIGIAACQASGLRIAFGSMTKPLQVGNAAMNGLRAALFAQRGFSAPRNPFASPLGFIDFDGTGDFAPSYDAPRTEPDSGFYILETMFKDYPCCFALHGVIDAALQMRALPGYDCDSIERIDVVVNPGLPVLCSLNRPITTEETRFSMPYAIALTLAGHDPTSLDAWALQIAETPLIAALLARIRTTVGPQSQATSCTLSVHQSKQGTLSAVSTFRYPSVDPSSQWKHLNKKFMRNVGPLLGEMCTLYLVSECDQFVDLDDTSTLLRLTVPEPTTQER